MEQPSLSSSRSCFSYLSIVLIVMCAVVSTTNCGGGGSSPNPNETTQVVLQLSSSGNNQLSMFNIRVQSITLSSKSGKTVNLLSAPQSAEFLHVNGTAEPLVTVSVPQDTYTSATLTTVSDPGFTCVSLLPSGGLQTSEFAAYPKPSTVTLPAPIQISGAAMGLDLDLQVSQSATFSDCNLMNNTAFSIAPTFILTPVVTASEPTNPRNGKLNGITGLISWTGSPQSYTVTLPDGQAVPFAFNSTTDFQVGGFGYNNIVDMDLAIQEDGTLAATRFNLWDTWAGDIVMGPLMFVSNVQPKLFMLPRQQQGFDIPSGGNFDFTSATFRIASQFSNVSQLPFPASFSSSNMVPGQNVAVTVPMGTSFATGYPPAASITLAPQTINATVIATGTSGAFTTYTATLAPYDFFPALAVQAGQAKLLTNPNLVVVYADGNTQMMNTKALAAGSVTRFNGLVFNDNGTLRMDCAEVNDGVVE
jgi:hypothetical protein